MNLDQKFDRLCGLLERLLGQHGELPEEVGKIRLEILRHQLGIDAIDKRLQHVENEAEATGNIYVGDLKDKLKKYEGTQTHWVRYVIAAGVSLLFIFISALLGFWLKGGH